MWIDPHARKLAWHQNPDCKDIYEIRFKAHGVQQRPLGYFGPHLGIFTVVLWATHKGNQWRPKGFCRIAKQRWQNVQNHGASIREIEID